MRKFICRFILLTLLAGEISAPHAAMGKAREKQVQKPLDASRHSSPRRSQPGELISVIQMDPDFPVDQLQGPNVHVHRVRDGRGHEIPAPADRESIFAKAGVAAEVARWDDFERDMFLMRAQTKQLRELASIYPQVPQKNLKNLQLEIQRYRKARK